ncbi:hypothetical protein ABZ079_23595 [Streptomyces sp. NPDC006314]|uniref:hypothetical protein n=1 Tax=Streptomyces sp. NPDC006314 TaxID=3154475 RepID=UPI0033B58328
MTETQPHFQDRSTRAGSGEGHAQYTRESYRGIEGIDTVLSIVSAVLFFIAFLINAADISTNQTFTSTNIMLLGLTLLALHLAGVGGGWSARGRRR